MPTWKYVVVGYFATATLSCCRFPGLRDSYKGFLEEHHDTYAQYNYHSFPPRILFCPPVGIQPYTFANMLITPRQDFVFLSLRHPENTQNG